MYVVNVDHCKGCILLRLLIRYVVMCMVSLGISFFVSNAITA